jgi:hypothetical protein
MIFSRNLSTVAHLSPTNVALKLSNASGSSSTRQILLTSGLRIAARTESVVAGTSGGRCGMREVRISSDRRGKICCGERTSDRRREAVIGIEG